VNQVFDVPKHMPSFDSKEDFQRVKMEYGYQMLDISPEDVIDNCVYVLYDIKSDFPRLERIKIRKVKRERDVFGAFNPFEDYHSGMYLKHRLFLPQLHIRRTVDYDKYGDVAHNSTEYKLVSEIQKLEQRTMQDALAQVKSNGYVLRKLLINWEDTQVMDRPDVSSFRHTLMAYKRIGIVIYRSVEREPYMTKNPYLNW